MNGFEEVRITWKDREYRIPPDQVMRCIAKIEDIITLTELQRYSEAKTIPFAKIALAFGAVLRHAGAQVNDFEVYRAMFSEALDAEDKPLDEGGKYLVAVEAVHKLMVLMLPPDYLAAKLAQMNKMNDQEGEAKKH